MKKLKVITFFKYIEKSIKLIYNKNKLKFIRINIYEYFKIILYL